MSLSIATATALKQLYNFKGNFNAAVQQILTAAGLTSVVERSNTTLPTPSRVEITFNLGAAANQAPIPGLIYNGAMAYDFWEGCDLALRLCTIRPEDQGSAIPGVVSLHDEFCATIYAIIEERQRPFDGILPLYDVVKILPKRTQSGLDPRFMEDWTEIVFEIWFGIRPSAWPMT